MIRATVRSKPVQPGFVHSLRLTAALIGAAVLMSAAQAQASRVPLQREPVLNAPRLVVTAPAEMPVVLRSVRMRAEINGRSALTTIELTFHNPNARQLEGELQFPLREGQTVVGMAMDVNGVLRDAVPIEKARGEAVFEDVTRTRIDPALLSVTQGDNYKLRVYPLPARGDKVVVLRIAEWLQGSGGRAAYRLPIDYGRIAHISATLQVSGVAGKPTAGARVVSAMPEFAKAGNGYRLDWSANDAVTSGTLDVALAPSAGGGVTTQRVEGHDYFVAQLPVAAQSAPRPLPRAVTIAWDASGSGAQRDHDSEFALLDAYFAKARRMTVQLVRIRDAAEAPQRFEIVDGNWRELRSALENMVYDGATDLGAFRASGDADEVLLFSDGLSNFGAQRFDAAGKPVTTINAAARADTARLRGIAEQAGGRYIDLTAQTRASASAKLLRASTRIVALEADGATQLVAASVHPDDGTLTVAGELTQRKATVRAIVLQPDGRRQTIALDVEAARDDGTIAAQAWARMKIASLDGEYEFHRAEIRRIGLAHSIVTRDTSLIILDRAEDYARHGVAAPPELAEQVAQLRAQIAARERTSAQSQLEAVVKEFDARRAWWAREFPKGAPPKAEARSGSMDALSALDAPRSAGMLQERRRADSAPAMAAAPAARAQAGNSFAPARELAQTLAKSARGERSDDAAPATAIRLRPAASDAPYLARLRAVPAEQMYRHYLDERASYANSTAFILDVADLMYERGQAMLATRVLSNLAEMDLENRQVLRILGARLMQAHRADLAVPVYEKVLRLAPQEPQSQRDLGLALAAAGKPQAAVDALYEVGRRQWPRFPEIELIALTEMNAIVAAQASVAPPVDTSRIDPRVLGNLPLDLRATLTWDSDNTDIDLWIVDPNGETAYYGHPDTYQGGHVSRDITSGYGPEEFLLKRAKPGKYTVYAKFYGHRQQIVSGATTIQLEFFSAFGTPQQKQQGVTLRLKEAKDQVLVGEFVVDAPSAMP